jgi:hypothetical protein
MRAHWECDKNKVRNVIPAKTNPFFLALRKNARITKGIGSKPNMSAIALCQSDEPPLITL